MQNHPLGMIIYVNAITIVLVAVHMQMPRICGGHENVEGYV